MSNGIAVERADSEPRSFSELAQDAVPGDVVMGYVGPKFVAYMATDEFFGDHSRKFVDLHSGLTTCVDSDREAELLTGGDKLMIRRLQ